MLTYMSKVEFYEETVATEVVSCFIDIILLPRLSNVTLSNTGDKKKMDVTGTRVEYAIIIK